METVRCRKIGGSIVVALPRSYVRELGLLRGRYLDVSLVDGKIIMVPWPEKGHNQGRLL